MADKPAQRVNFREEFLMSMLKSLSSAVSGLKAQQTAMDTIGNNIANVNTSAFRSSTTNFEDLFYNTLSGATEETDPSQVGYGTQVSSVTKNMTSGGATTTDAAWNLYIDGEGYFAVSTDSTANTESSTNSADYYTRVGDFTFDSNGYLVDSNGNYVEGTSDDGTILSPLKLIGSYLTTSTTSTDDDDNTTTTYSSTAIDDDVYSDITDITFNSDGTITAVYDGTSYTITAGDDSDADDTPDDYLKVALCTFVNEGGLSSVGNNYYEATAASGNAAYTTAGTDNTTSLESSALESSNVDLATEFTNMIISQRGFQANARVITTSDTMLEELVDLKRS
jgi:flagellar hook protein FlgE